MKYLVVIGLFVLLVVLLLRRLRPYLRLVQQFIDTLRRVQRMNATRAGSPGKSPEKLVCCASCGTWVPSGRALNAGADNAVFCSSGCQSLSTKRKQSTS